MGKKGRNGGGSAAAADTAVGRSRWMKQPPADTVEQSLVTGDESDGSVLDKPTGADQTGAARSFRLMEARHQSIDEMEAADRAMRAQRGITSSIASKRDRHDCYHQSVQLPSEEVKNLETMYIDVHRRNADITTDLPPSDDESSESNESDTDSTDDGYSNKPRQYSMRKRNAPPKPQIFLEDFCGTSVLADAWCKQHASRTSFGVDIDPAVIEYARTHSLIHPHSTRVHVKTGTVLEAPSKYGIPPVDLIAALNYGSFYFHQRSDLIKYYRRCRDALHHGGVLVVDCFGGAKVSSTAGRLFQRRFGDFTYFFEQKPMDVMSNRVAVHLHFRFDDGSWMKDCYTYDFRVYSINDIREAMAEAGFKKSYVWIASSAEERQASRKSRKAKPAGDSDEDQQNGDNDLAHGHTGASLDLDAGVYEYQRVATSSLKQLESFNAYIVGII